jgi:hypothetical protein
MRHVHFVVVLSLIGPAAVRADDAPEPFGALAGGWVRPSVTYDGKKYPHMTWSKDGKDVVYPGLQLIARGKTRSLLVHGAPSLVYWNPGPVSYDLVVGEGKEKGTLAIAVGGRKLQFGYTLQRDTLTITGTEKVPAGHWLGDYDISGTWVRPTKGYIE